MDHKAAKFFTKSQIKPEQIIYFTRNQRKSEIYLTDGTMVDTYIPIKYLLSALPKGAFLNITKGVVVSSDKIESITGGIYTMSDGKQFKGRQRGAGEHKANRHYLENRVKPLHRIMAETIGERFSVLDLSPLPSCVVEIVHNTAGREVDFVFRYCNAAMAQQEGYELNHIINRSYYEIFRTSDRKWLKIYSDVAINGETKIVEDYDKKHGQTITVYCYQPLEGFCACTLIKGTVK